VADVFDIQMQIASDVNTAVQPLVGTSFPLPLLSPDAAIFGPTRTVPSIEILPGNILLEEIMNRLEGGKAQIQIESESYDLPAPQFLSESDIDPSTIPVPAIGFTTSGKVITIAGIAQAGDAIGVQQGTNGAGYAVQATDTLPSIAANLAASMVINGIPCSVSGSAITVTLGPFQVSVGTSWSRVREAQRRRKVFFASIYTTTPYDRSYIGKAIEGVYSPGSRLSMPDGTLATLVPMSMNPMQSSDFDVQQRDTTWARRVSWVFDFITTTSIPVTQVMAVPITLLGGYGSGFLGGEALDTQGALDTLGGLDGAWPPPLASQL
jgi:hypothetical protein